ncbi:MAG: AI-2E family transporter [Patescibacteria group bacterium]
MKPDSSISITSGTFIRAIIIAAAAYAIWTLRSLALLVLTAVVIASAIEPGVAYLVRHKFPRVLAVLFMYVVVFGSFFGIIYFFLPPILSDAQGIFSLIPQYLDQLNLSIVTLPDISSGGALAGEAQSALHTLLAFRELFTGSSQGAFRLVATFFGGIFAFGLIVVLSFYFAMQETGVDDFLRLITPANQEEYVVDLWLRAKTKIGLWMQGQVLSSVIGGVLAYLGLLLLGIPYAFILAIFTAAMMLIPIFGSFISAFAPIILAFSVGGVSLALITAGLYVIINQFESHIIHPLVVNKVVGIPPLLVILALIVGGELAGFLGVLLAIPLAAALREFLSDYDKGKRAAQQIVS